MRATVLIGLWMLAASAAADPVYKWKDEQGVTHYGDKPGSANAKAVDLPGLQSYGLLPSRKSGKSSTSTRLLNGPAPYGGSGPRVDVTQPAPDATLPSGKFTVTVNLTPALGNGQNLNYYLDGELQNPVPTVSTAFLFTGADNGDHMVSAAVIDSSGREISRSEPVLVHLQPLTTAR